MVGAFVLGLCSVAVLSDWRSVGSEFAHQVDVSVHSVMGVRGALPRTASAGLRVATGLGLALAALGYLGLGIAVLLGRIVLAT